MYNVSKSESSIYFLYKDQSKKAQKEYFIKFLNFVSKLLPKDFFFDTRKTLNLKSINQKMKEKHGFLVDF